MTSREFIHKVFNGELGRLDAYNISLELTEREVLKIEMLIIEIDEFCKLKTLGFENAFKWRIDRAMPNPTNYDRSAILRAGFNESEIPDIDDRVYYVLSDPSNKDLFEDENLDYEKLFYPDLCKSLYQLKTDLLSFLDSQNETLSTNKNKDKENTPFEDEQTKNLFEYIVKNWNNDTANKWGYIWIHIVELNNGNLTVKGDYETYLRKYHNFTKGKPNYDSCNSKTRFEELDKLNKEFLENLDLN